MPIGAASLGAHTACGEQFPGCLGRLHAFGEGRLVDIQLTHRAVHVPRRDRGARDDGAGAAPAASAHGLLASRRSCWSRRSLLGALNVWLGEHAGLIVAHLMLGTLLWSDGGASRDRALPASAPAGATGRRRTAAPAATA